MAVVTHWVEVGGIGARRLRVVCIYSSIASNSAFIWAVVGRSKYISVSESHDSVSDTGTD
jgi:hypothetical protein